MEVQLTETTAGSKIRNLTKRIRVIQGGTSAGKTYEILQQWILAGLEDNPEFKGVNSIVSESLPHLKRGAMRDFLTILKENHLYDINNHNRSDSIYTINDAQYEFFSADQDDKLRGARRKNLFINEANNISQSAFDQLEVRTMYTTWIDFNPVAEFWGHELKNVDFIKLTYKDNEMLHPNTVASIEARKHNEQWWKVYGLGEIGTLEGLILTNWEVIDSVPNEAELLASGLDFGFTNDPTVIITAYRYNGEVILDELLYKRGMTNGEIGNFLKTKVTGTIYADSAEPKSIKEIRQYGISIQGAKKGKDSVKYGLDLLQDYKLRPTKHSTNLIKALRNYSWDKSKEGKYTNKPNHAFSDAIDAVRYMAVMRLKNNQGQYNIV